MLLRSCFPCAFHDVRQDGEARMSHCRKENCWSQYSKCVTLKALNKFLDEDRADCQRSFSALSHASSSVE